MSDDKDPIWTKACRLQRHNKQMRIVYLSATMVNIAIGIIFQHRLSWIVAIITLGFGIWNEWVIDATRDAMHDYNKRVGRTDRDIP